MLRGEGRRCHKPLRLHSLLLLCLPVLAGAAHPDLAWSSTEFAPSQGAPPAWQCKWILCVLLTVRALGLQLEYPADSVQC